MLYFARVVDNRNFGQSGTIEVFLPQKNYSENIDLIINDIGKELKTIKQNLTNDESNNTDMNNMIFITQSKNKTFSSNNIVYKI